MHQLFVSGRLCLFGEHSDWAGAFQSEDPEIVAGACIVCGTDQGIAASAQEARRFEMVTRLANGDCREVAIAMDGNTLRAATAAGDFFSYASGVAAVMRERYGVAGVRIEVQACDLPEQRGLSSSAAVCVLVARAFNRVYDLDLTTRDEMDLAYAGEVATGSRCGRMDQACAYGKIPVLLRFAGAHPQVEALPVGATFHLLIVDLCSRKDTRRILADLHEAFLAPPSATRMRLRRALGEENKRLVEAAAQALALGDTMALGSLMTQAQLLFDDHVAPACASELAAPRLHEILQAAQTKDLVWGGKGVGSQGDGTAQFVCRGQAERDELNHRLTVAFGVECLDLTILPVSGTSLAEQRTP